MPLIRSLVSSYYTKLISVILSLGKIMLFYSCYKEKKLVYITIIAPFSYQPFFILSVPN